MGHYRRYYGNLNGDMLSPTRAELVAVILTMLDQNSLHIGTDSMAVVKRAERLLRLDRNACSKPWGTTKDGELWETFYNIAKWRGGAATTKITISVSSAPLARIAVKA